MLRIFIALSIGTAGFVARDHTAYPCGIKIAASAPRTKKLMPRSERPSRVLLLGDHSRRTVTALFDAGHSVDVADDATSARAQSYRVIVTDSAHEEEARRAWPGIIIVSSEGSSGDVLARVEAELRGRPNARRIARRPVRQLQARQPTATSDTSGRERIAAGQGEEARDAPIASGGSREPSSVSVQVTSSGSEPPAQPDARAADQRVASAKVAAETKPPAAEEPPAEPERSNSRPSTRVFFRASSAALGSSARSSLRKTARWLAKHPGGRVTLEGHTFTVGPAEVNRRLGQGRADAVKEFLLQNGVDEARIQTESFGMTRPGYKPGTNPKNRRVVIVIGS